MARHPLADGDDAGATVAAGELIGDKRLEPVGRAIPGIEQVLDRLARQVVRLEAGKLLDVCQHPVHFDAGGVFYLVVTLGMEPDPFADRVLRRHPGLVLRLGQAAMAFEDILLGYRRRLELEENVGRLGEVERELRGDFDGHMPGQCTGRAGVPSED